MTFTENTEYDQCTICLGRAAPSDEPGPLLCTLCADEASRCRDCGTELSRSDDGRCDRCTHRPTDDRDSVAEWADHLNPEDFN